MAVKTSLIWDMPEDQFRKLILKSNTYTEILARFGLLNRGDNHKTLKARISTLGITFKSVGYSISNIDRKKKPLKDFLKKGVIYTGARLKNKLLKEGALKNTCSECGLPAEWRNKPLSLHLDHENGDPSDNRINNLRLLCPNCHSQTETYCGKALRKKRVLTLCIKCEKPLLGKVHRTGLCRVCSNKRERPSRIPPREVLEKLLKTESMTRIGKRFGVTGNSVKKWAVKYGIENIPGRGYWAKVNAFALPSEREFRDLCKTKTKAEIGKHYGVTDSVIRKWYKHFKIVRQTGSFWSKKYWDYKRLGM